MDDFHIIAADDVDDAIRQVAEMTGLPVRYARMVVGLPAFMGWLSETEGAQSYFQTAYPKRQSMDQ